MYGLTQKVGTCDLVAGVGFAEKLTLSMSLIGHNCRGAVYAVTTYIHSCD